MKFEIGKCYKHTTGSTMRIAGECITTLYGKTLIAENLGNGEYFVAVGKSEDAAANWTEIEQEEWLKNFR